MQSGVSGQGRAMGREERSGRTGRIAACLATIGLAGGLALSGVVQPVAAQEPDRPTLHHAHLNSVDPDAAVAWYLSLWHEGEAGEIAGYPAFVAEMPLLFNRVAAPPSGGWDRVRQRAHPQSPFWHIGAFVNTTGLLADLEGRGYEVLRLMVGPDDREGVLRSGLTPYNGIVTADALGSAEPADPRDGGFSYVVGPDDALVELTGSPQTNPAFAHVHLFHENPRCAANWYVDVLGFGHAPYRDANGERQERARWDPCEAEPGAAGWPSLEHGGTVRSPSATVVHGSGSISMYPRQCFGGRCDVDGPLVPSAGQVLDHVAFQTDRFDALMERVRERGVEVLREPYSFGATRAVMLRGPDGLSIEIVEGSGR